MDNRLARLVRRVLVETHAEHLADRVTSRLLSAIRTFHNRPENFSPDTKEAVFETDVGTYTDQASLRSLIGLRRLVAVSLYLDCGKQMEAVLSRDASEYYKTGDSVHPAKALRIGSTLKLKSTQPFSAFSVVYNAPPIVTEDDIGTWLDEQQLEFAVSEAIAYTFAQTGDDASSYYARQAKLQLAQLVNGLDVT